MSLPGENESVWVATTPSMRRYSALDGDLDVDVCIIGAGIAGLTAALLLKRAGRSVAVLENRVIGHQVTGRSNAKLTSLHGLIYADLAQRMGEDKARIYGDANQSAIAHVAAWVEELSIDCGFERKPAYTFTADPSRVADIEREADMARRLGLPAQVVRESPLPYGIEAAVRFDDQAQINPFAYLEALASAVDGFGSFVFEDTRALAVADGEPATVTTATGTVRARDVIVATNLPVIPEGDFHKKTGPRSHVAVAATIAEASAPDGLFLSIDAPTHSVRTAPYRSGSRLLVVIGPSYATGEVGDVSGMVEDLTRFVGERFPDAGPVRWYWTNMDYDSLDRVPFVGRANKDVEHLHVATGFSSWGISNGTAAGILLCEALCGRSSPWAGLYDATRSPGEAPNQGHPPMLSGGGGDPREGDPDELGKGEAAVFARGDEKIAAYRDEQGTLHTVSAACTHLGCTVAWNDAARSWECPCHGSVFSPDGSVLKGPAVRDLAHRDSPGGDGQGRG